MNEKVKETEFYFMKKSLINFDKNNLLSMCKMCDDIKQPTFYSTDSVHTQNLFNQIREILYPTYNFSLYREKYLSF